MVQTPGRVVEAGGDVLRLQVRILAQDLLRRLARGQQLQDLPDPACIPRMQGRPPHCSGSIEIRSNKLDIAPSVRSTTLCRLALQRLIAESEILRLFSRSHACR